MANASVCACANLDDMSRCGCARECTLRLMRYAVGGRGCVGHEEIEEAQVAAAAEWYATSGCEADVWVLILHVHVHATPMCTAERQK